MKVTDLNEAEKIVANNPNLSWEGWDIIHLVQDDYAEYLHTGLMDKQSKKWYKKTIISCNADGWNIPDSVIL